MLLVEKCAVVVAFLLFAASSVRAQTSPGTEIRTEMRNVSYHYTDRIAIQIQMLQGTRADRSGPRAGIR